MSTSKQAWAYGIKDNFNFYKINILVDLLYSIAYTNALTQSDI